MNMLVQAKSPSTKPAAVPSPRDIARAARVSVATVSLALNDHPRVAPRTKLRVLEAAATLGYVPNHAARRLARSRFTQQTDPFDQVGFVFFDRHSSELDGVYLSMLRGTEHQLSLMRAAMVFVRVATGADREKVLRLVKAGWIDGWMVVGEVDDDSIRLVHASRRPVVVLGGHRCAAPIHCADIDFLAVGKLAAQHLASLGHRRVGYIGGGMRMPYQHDMLAGFRAAGQESNLEMDDELIQTSGAELNRPLSDKLRRLLALRPLPSAIVTAEPSYAGMALEILRQYELQVPAEISLLGCQSDASSTGTPNITRIEQPFAEVGRAGVSLLRELAEQPQTPLRQVQISPVLVEGWSCGHPRTNPISISKE